MFDHMRLSTAVFVSHTADMASYPAQRSFVQAAVDAVLRAGYLAVDMAYFSAREGQPADYCIRRVSECDVYLGLIGFRYGSLVPEREISYTHLEFTTATKLGKPRLLFLLDEEAPVPRRLIDLDGRPIDAFRATLKNAGAIVRTFREPGDLGESVLHALMELQSELTGRRSSRPDRTPTVPWMAPVVAQNTVKRSEESRILLKHLLAPAASAAAPPIHLAGPGGFGKTTLAAAVCQLPEVKRRYPGGLLWASLNGDVERTDATLSELLSDFCGILGGESHRMSSPLTASVLLGQLLDRREPTLIVLDDVRSASQVAPFLQGGSSARRMVVSRFTDVVANTGQSLILSEMTHEEGCATVSAGLDLDRSYHPMISQLVHATGHWPLLLGLMNAAVRVQVDHGALPNEAVDWVLKRLATHGPATFDSVDSHRSRSVAATVEASLDALSEDERERYMDLAFLDYRLDIPSSFPAEIWEPYGVSRRQADRIYEKLVRAGLVTHRWIDGLPFFRIHEVLRSYLRYRMDDREVTGRHEGVLRAGLLRLPDTPSPDGGTSSWWELPEDASYFWRSVPFHLHELGQDDKLGDLVSDLRWIVGKITALGSVAMVEGDLELAGTPLARRLAFGLGQSAHLLDVADAIECTIVSRLGELHDLRDVVVPFRESLRLPRLESLWPLPDHYHRSLSRILTGHTKAVVSCAVSPVGLVATASFDRTVRIWDMRTGEIVRVLVGHADAVRGCTFSPDGTLVASVGDDQTIRLWDMASGQSHAVLAGHTDVVSCCSFSPDGRKLATGGFDGSLRLWDVATERQLAVLNGHSDWIRACAFSPCGSWVVTAGHDEKIIVWDVANKKSRSVLVGHTDWVRDCAFTSDGKKVVSASEDCTVRVWHTESSTIDTVFECGDLAVSACAVSPDGKNVVSGGYDGLVRVFDVSSGQVREVLTGHTSGVSRCAFSPDGKQLITSSYDGTARVWLLARIGDDRPKRLENSVRRRMDCAYSPDGNWLVTGDAGGTATVWDARDGARCFTLTGHESDVTSCRFAADGTVLVTVGGDGYLRIWDVPTGLLRNALQAHDGAINSCAISPDSMTVASGGADGTVQIRSISDGRRLSSLASHAAPVTCCAFSPDGSTLATTSDDQTIFLWDTRTFQIRATLTGHAGTVTGCDFSPEGGLLATTSGDQTAILWDIESFQVRAILTGHAGIVTGCHFSPDGHLVATTGRDRTLRIWRTSDPTTVATAIKVSEPLLSCAWHPDGGQVGAAGDGGIYIFSYIRASLELERTQTTARQRANG